MVSTASAGRAALIILDGFGHSPARKGNAVWQARRRGVAPFIDSLYGNHRLVLLKACGRAVGLRDGVMGNSEVNHLNMGAGRVIKSRLMTVDDALAGSDADHNPALAGAIEQVKRHGSALHLAGILQGDEGAVHGHIDHLFGLLETAKRNGVRDIKIHLFTDGRDTDVQAALNKYLPLLEEKITALGMREQVKIATVMGRYYAMDRGAKWDHTYWAMDVLANGARAGNIRRAASASDALRSAYPEDRSDEFIKPTVIGDYNGVGENDAFIFWNYRVDRATQLTMAFTESTPEKLRTWASARSGALDDALFGRMKAITTRLPNLYFATMYEYYDGQEGHIAFRESAVIEPTIGQVVSLAGLRQLHAAEAEKAVHVTTYLNGLRPTPFEGEDREIVASRKEEAPEQRYDLIPEMSAYRVTERVMSAVARNPYHFIALNFANGDMVGHTGNLEATIQAVGHMDNCLRAIVPALVARGFSVAITTDHGNCDDMFVVDAKGRMVLRDGRPIPSTTHSMRPVPFWLVGNGTANLKRRGIVPQIGPTVLELMGLRVPPEMMSSLIRRG